MFLRTGLAWIVGGALPRLLPSGHARTGRESSSLLTSRAPALLRGGEPLYPIHAFYSIRERAFCQQPGTVVLGLALCAVAALFNQLGKVTIVTILLIAVIDLGCGLMLLTSPMGLDVSNLPAISVFPVALGNMLFTIVVLMFAPRTMELNMVLADFNHGL
jgi:hypothetical protein